MIISYDSKFSYIEIYDNYLIAVMKEGITILPEHNDSLVKIVEKHFKNKYFVYITHRINSYTINPIIYFETAKIKNLVGFSVVSNDPKQKMQTKIEKVFYNKEFMQFETMEDALEWKDMILKRYK
ncbi:hypothetical protein [Aquimarina longa]|uniref:hypothetical protein n=1 Tax=Aquimarina longa TaxID=1080221 RepID=UPI000780597D|nr:hypothetical protein [Aquimarina longa]